jgi:pSer/pThr/pTyr-binding forkhead associated (FHA) protein
LWGAATRIGRLSDKDIVLDTDTSFVISDLRSAHGVEVADKLIRSSATLVNGDHICISDYEFTLEIGEK